MQAAGTPAVEGGAAIEAPGGMRGVWWLLKAVVGGVGAWVLVVVSIAFLAAGVGFLSVSTEWLVPLLEVAITPVTLVLSVTFATAAFMLSQEGSLPGDWSRQQILGLLGVYLFFGVIALGGVLLYLALAGVWWAEGPLLSMVGVVAIGFTALGVIAVYRLGLILTGLCPSPQQPPSAAPNALVRWGAGCTGATVVSLGLATAYQKQEMVAAAFLILTVCLSLVGITLAVIGMWRAWRSNQAGMGLGAIALMWGIVPWIVWFLTSS